MNTQNPPRVWIRSVLVLFLGIVSIYGVVACDDDNDGPGCNAVPADMTDDFFQRNSVNYFCIVDGTQVNYSIFSEITPDGAFCNLFYSSGNLAGQGPGSITFSGEIDETGTLCDFTGTDPLLFVNSQSERGFVNSGEAFFSEPDNAKRLTFAANVDFSIIGNFDWPPTECTCIGTN